MLIRGLLNVKSQHYLDLIFSHCLLPLSYIQKSYFKITFANPESHSLSWMWRLGSYLSINEKSDCSLLFLSILRLAKRVIGGKNMPETKLKAGQLTKQYKTDDDFNYVQMTVNKDDIYGLIGKNNARKWFYSLNCSQFSRLQRKVSHVCFEWWHTMGKRNCS